jgi:hypothetical protein
MKRVCSLFVSLGLCVSVLAPVRAEISVSGTTPSSVHSLQSWCDQHIPLVYRTHSHLTVRVLSDPQMDSYLHSSNDGLSHDQGNDDTDNSDDDLSDVDGVYENGPPRIAIRQNSDGDVDDFTFGHEYGHYVWFNLLSASDRQRYQRLYDHLKSSGHLVTRYAGTNVEEGFAEAFSFYLAAPPILAHRDPASYQFLNQWPSQPSVARSFHESAH